MSKNIVICCDGTSNSPTDQEDGKPCPSNVWKFYDALLSSAGSDWKQIGFYDAGVGSGTSSVSRALGKLGALLTSFGKLGRILGKIFGTGNRLFEAGTGTGIRENILDGYSAIVRLYQPGDQIFLIGFSRGAYTARCIGGLIRKAGLLKAENARYAPDLVKLYVNRRPTASVSLRDGICYENSTVNIAFIGVWDTVASLGLPLWGWWFRPLGFGSNDGYRDSRPVVCDLACHAMSMDEKRSQFLVTPFDENPKDKSEISEQIEQRWFRGTHAGVGGGYADEALSNIPLLWMIERASSKGLLFDVGKTTAIRGNPLGDVHDELVRQPFWQAFVSWPRWFPCNRPNESNGLPEYSGFGIIDSSVMIRAQNPFRKRFQSTAVHPDELCWLDVDQSVEIQVKASHPWNRSGVVLEPGGIYRIDYSPQKGGRWRDKEEDECGPEGQANVGFVRERLKYAKRAPNAHWFELIAYVAVPQSWPLIEKSMVDLLKLLLIADPKGLTDQYLRLGAQMVSAQNGKALSAVIQMEPDSPAGMLYTFANDHWLFYGNNSGALNLSITRIDAPLGFCPIRLGIESRCS